MRIVGLDISTKTGFAILNDGELVKHGLIQTPDFQSDIMEDHRLLQKAEFQATELASLLSKENPDLIVVEQTNAGKFRTSQKQLEFIHCLFLCACGDLGIMDKIRYVDTSAWRRGLKIKLNDDQRLHNKKVKKKQARGKITPKHLAVLYVNEQYGLKLKLKDNDIADAICLVSYGKDLFKAISKKLVNQPINFDKTFQFH